MKKIFKLFKSTRLSANAKSEKALHLKAVDFDRNRAREVYHSLYFSH